MMGAMIRAAFLCFLLAGCSFASDYGQSGKRGVASVSSFPSSQGRQGIKTARDLYGVCRQALTKGSFDFSSCESYIAGFAGGLVIMQAYIYPRISHMDCPTKEKDIVFYSKGSKAYCLPSASSLDVHSLPFIASWMHDHPGYELQNLEVAALSFIKWADDHPDDLDIEAFSGLDQSFKVNFPCNNES